MERWTRHQVAELLHVSITTVRRMEGRDLHPTLHSDGTRFFDSSEVRLLAASRAEKPVTRQTDDGEVAGRVFELFRAGADLRKVVITARVHPRLVRDLYAEWLVSLNEGEQQRRNAAIDADDRRERARMEREHKQWAKALSSRLGVPGRPEAGR